MYEGLGSGLRRNDENLRLLEVSSIQRKSGRGFPGIFVSESALVLGFDYRDGILLLPEAPDSVAKLT